MLPQGWPGQSPGRFCGGPASEGALPATWKTSSTNLHLRESLFSGKQRTQFPPAIHPLVSTCPATAGLLATLPSWHGEGLFVRAMLYSTSQHLEASTVWFPWGEPVCITSQELQTVSEWEASPGENVALDHRGKQWLFDWPMSGLHERAFTV